MVAASISELLTQVSSWKKSGNSIVFTNGVFDILHIGHVTYLEKARELGDKLIIGLNSDESVRRLAKGPERPINPEYARAYLLNALRCVDAVIVFSEDTPLELIRMIEPDVLVKGGDYNSEESDPSARTFIVGSIEVRANNGKVVVIPLVDGFSTTSLLKKMRS